ncbi:MAG: hypothetical protein HYW49_13990 [Deltaproteobacteria bacterium]|nr:hypothetical protein [Deltaproteobacteria bacterium]
MKVQILALMAVSGLNAFAGNPVVAIGDCRNITSNGILTHRKIAVRVESDSQNELNYLCRTKVAKSVSAEYSADPANVESSVSGIVKLDQEELRRLSSLIANPSKKSSQLTLKADLLVE